MNIEGLIVVGGNGSLSGANDLAKDGFPVIGIPGSIDDDIWGTEVCLGVDTALNIIIEAVDRIRDCASSIQRAFLVEVMGRDCGALALMAATACAADYALIPEVKSPPLSDIATRITTAYTLGQPHCVILVAEGWKPGIDTLTKYLQKEQEKTGFDVRTSVLGYTQRGGAPSYRDRMWATKMGIAAVDALLAGETGKMVGSVKGKIDLIPLADIVGRLKPVSEVLAQRYGELQASRFLKG
jgi:6-phosphofructokinase 1